MLFSIARRCQWLQNIYISFSTLVPPAVTHSTGIIDILKKALWHAAMEKMEGAYYEFGVFEGTSLLAAVKTQRRISARGMERFLGTPVARRFYGFDSFEGGFKYGGNDITHPVFREGAYESSYARCQRRLRRYPEATLVKGYFEHSLQGDALAGQAQEPCAVAFIDCDLQSSATQALTFLYPRLQPGSIVILDDAFAYKGDPQQGVFGAWNAFLATHPNVRVREFFTYGVSGRSYVVYAL